MINFFVCCGKYLFVKYWMNFSMVDIPSTGSMLVYIDTASHVNSRSTGGSLPSNLRRSMIWWESLR